MMGEGRTVEEEGQAEKKKGSLSRTVTILLTENLDLKHIVTGEGTSTGDGTENVGTSTLEEGLHALVLGNLDESLDGGRVLLGLTGGHHHAAADGIDGVGGETGSGGDEPGESEGGTTLNGVGDVSVGITGQHTEHDGLDGIVQTEVQTTVDDDTNARDDETTVETSNTVGSQSLPVNVYQSVELTLSSLLGRLVIVSKTSTGIIQRVDDAQGGSSCETTGHDVSGEGLGVSILILGPAEQALEVILEGEVQGLGREVTQHVSQVSSPQGSYSLLLGNSHEAINNSSVGLLETTRLQHLILAWATSKTFCKIGEIHNNKKQKRSSVWG